MRTKLGYGIGAGANGVAVAGLSGAILQVYLNQVLGLPALLVGTIIMVSLIVDAVVDPAIGHWSDRTRSRWGRRHPFMYASAIPVAIFFYLLWNAPAMPTTGRLVAFTVTMMIAARLSSSFYTIPSDALMPELTPDYDQRTTLVSYRWFFGIIAGAGMPFILYEFFLGQGMLGILDRGGYARFGVLTAAVAFVSIIASSLATHERIGHLPSQAAPAARGRLRWRDLGRTFANRSLIALMLGGVLGGIGGGLSAGLSIYMLTHFWNLTPSQFGFLIPVGSVGSIVAVFLAPFLSRRFGKKSAVIGLFSVSVVTATGPVLLRLLDVIELNRWVTYILIVDSMITSTVAVIGYILVGSMMADVVEDVAVRTGLRSEGLLFAANGLLPKFAGGIGAFIAGLLLTLVRFPTHAVRGTVSPVIVRHLAMVYLPSTVFFSVVSIAVLGLYRIDRRTHEQNLQTLRDAEAAATASHVTRAVVAGEGSAPVSGMF